MFDLTNLDEAKLQAAIANAESKLPESSNDPILQFKADMGEHGTWTVGQELKSVQGQQGLFLAHSIKRGYCAFEKREKGDNRPPKFLGEVLEPLFGDRKADASEVSGPEAEVSRKSTVQVYLPELNMQTLFRSGTRGSEDAIDSLAGQIIARMRAGERVYLHPLVRFDQSSYKHPTWGRQNKPIFEIVAWCDVAGNREPEKEALSARLSQFGRRQWSIIR